MHQKKGLIFAVLIFIIFYCSFIYVTRIGKSNKLNSTSIERLSTNDISINSELLRKIIREELDRDKNRKD